MLTTEVGGGGASFKKITYKQLGKYELIDQKHAAKYFGNLEYRPNRGGIQDGVIVDIFLL